MNSHKIHRSVIATLGCSVAVMVIGGCACCGSCKDTAAASHRHGDAKTVEVVNAICPIGEDPIDTKAVEVGLTRQWRGRTVGFCCEGCLGPWDSMSDAEREQKLSTALNSGN